MPESCSHLELPDEIRQRAVRDIGALCMLPDMQRDGYAWADIGVIGAELLGNLYTEGHSFFSRPKEVLMRYRTGVGAGYREEKGGNTGNPLDPDLNSGFQYQHFKAGIIPHQDEIQPLLRAANSYLYIAELVVARFSAEVAEHYGQPGRVVGIDPASLLQLNFFPLRPGDFIWQGPHEDGTEVSVLTADAEGLESVADGRRPAIRFNFEADFRRVLVMPGSVLSAMIDCDDIPPLYHQVTNYPRTKPRISIPYFAIPPKGTRPFRGNQDVDLAVDQGAAAVGLTRDGSPLIY